MSSFVHGWPNTRNIWIARVILVVVLLALVIGLGYMHINGTYKPWMKCSHVLAGSWLCDNWDIVDHIPQTVKDVLNWPGQICNWFKGGCTPNLVCDPYITKKCVDVNVLRPLGICGWFDQCPSEATLPIPGLKGFIDPPLEWLRGVTVWTIFAVFVIASLILTILYNIIVKPIIRLMRRDPEEWRKLLENLRTWFLILAVFLLLFLVSVARTGGVEPPHFLEPLWKTLGWKWN
jgi:hypothetical protein